MHACTCRCDNSDDLPASRSQNGYLYGMKSVRLFSVKTVTLQHMTDMMTPRWCASTLAHAPRVRHTPVTAGTRLCSSPRA